MTTISLPAFSARCATLQSRDDRRAGRDADEQSFFQRKPARHGDRFVVGDSDDFVDVVAAQNAGNESGADALNLVRRWLSAGKHGTVGRLDGDRFERWLLRLDVLADASDGSAGADSGNQNVNAPVSVVPNLGAGGFEMNLGIRRIVELLQHVAVGIAGENFFRLENRARHATRAGREHDLRAEGEQQHATLQAHGVGHDQNQLVALHRGDERQSDSGVAAGRFDQHRFAGMNFAGALRFVNHAHADAVFHAGQRILALQLRHDFRDAALGDFVQPHQRRVADQLRNVFRDLHGGCSPLFQDT